MVTFSIIKKNRKYFAATKDGYKCKILIDENSESLEIGTHELEVDDISVRSKYGTDLIFKLQARADEQQAAGICTLRHYVYNQDLVAECHQLGGKWDAEEKAWIFSGLVESEVEDLDALYNSELTAYEITFNCDRKGHAEPVYFLGVNLARATGRDSGAILADGVAIIDGGVTSGGSRANWQTIVREGTTMRLMLPCARVDALELDDKYTIKAI